MKSKTDKALIIVDLQNDFLPGGALGVDGGEEIIPIIHQLMDRFDVVIATQDIHPKGHVSFAETHGKQVGETVELEGQTQELWPIHCVENTHGAALADGLNKDKIQAYFKKGTDLQVDSYSAFFDNDYESETGLDDYLRQRKVKTLYLVGLTTDFCVKFTALDALDLGFKVVIVRDACKGVFDEERALEELKKKGAKIVFSKDLLSRQASFGLWSLLK
ncbi:MAG: bifunctional nicotinamidase/pyrazinamidase [Chlamydiales bacterium]|nr:bifunctional nicotinamidase/pyrazinamidase [Chlamydiales bacterium]